MNRNSFDNTEIEQYCVLINEIVLKYEWVIEKRIGIVNEFELPSLLYLRQMMDLGDAISILVEKSSGDVIDTLLRNLFELEMNFEYLDSNINMNSIKFLFFYYKKKYELYSQEIPGTPENIKLLNILRRDKNVHRDTLEFISNNSKTIESIDSLVKTLSNPLYSEVNKYYNEANRNEKKYWYSLLGGPKTFYELVNLNGKPSLYLARYSQWSELVHGLDIVNRNLKFEDDLIRIVTKRNPADLDFKVIETISILKRRIMGYAVKNLTEFSNEFANWMIDYDIRIKQTFPE